MSNVEPKPTPSGKTPPAEKKIDWDALRERSLQPGGFGAERTTLWPKLLHVRPEDITFSPLVEKSSLQHSDERQIRLDTDRSFVLYPVEEAMNERAKLQEELYELIVATMRQGYHDIVTVIFLTLPHDVQLAAMEKMSLHRLRDAMGQTLEPVMGLLRILQRLLRLADPEYAALLEEQAPLPYAVLSHLLTLFAHDMPALPLVQHVFDYILSRPPVAIVYLAAAVMLTHREEVQNLELRDEPGMIHSVLTSLPDLVDQTEAEIAQMRTSISSAGPKEGSSAAAEQFPLTPSSLPASDQGGPLPERLPYPTPPPELDGPEPAEGKDLPDRADLCIVAERVCIFPADIPLPPSPPPSPSLLPIPPSSARIRSPQSLPALLRQADSLMTTYPPTHNTLKLDSTFGPASALRTWSEDPSSLPSDEQAEELVAAGVDIVFADVPEPEPESDVGQDSDWLDEKRWFGLRRRRRSVTDKGKGREQHLFGGLLSQRRTILAGAVLALGVAMAVSIYSSRGGGGGAAKIAGIAGAAERIWSAAGWGF
ncbi:hypothetical protein K488DRAFT_88936 [Vararia minispora EC-137]|uniref:Uncharacterized protein n=1 Tax=Vararia minispora EC-137 TaxID=1314806 RepID=A0ACB8QC89_9AGAM|nr:hypothetical protein K488DRAFT_88936 [Vararia minispora EC-137]